MLPSLRNDEDVHTHVRGSVEETVRRECFSLRERRRKTTSYAPAHSRRIVCLFSLLGNQSAEASGFVRPINSFRRTSSFTPLADCATLRACEATHTYRRISTFSPFQTALTRSNSQPSADWIFALKTQHFREIYASLKCEGLRSLTLVSGRNIHATVPVLSIRIFNCRDVTGGGTTRGAKHHALADSSSSDELQQTCQGQTDYDRNSKSTLQPTINSSMQRSVQLQERRLADFTIILLQISFCR